MEDLPEAFGLTLEQLSKSEGRQSAPIDNTLDPTKEYEYVHKGYDKEGIPLYVLEEVKQ